MYLFILPILLFAQVDGAAQIRDISHSDGALVIYNENWQLWHQRQPVTKATETEGYPNLIFVLWDDGKVIWSEDEVTGSPPYFTGNVKPNTIDKVIAKLKERSSFWADDVQLDRFNPHAYCTAIRIIEDDKTSTTIRYDLELRDLLESGDVRQNAKATIGRSKDELLFENSWLWLRLQAHRILPSEFKIADGHLELNHGEIRWVGRELKIQGNTGN